MRRKRLMTKSEKTARSINWNVFYLKGVIANLKEMQRQANGSREPDEDNYRLELYSALGGIEAALNAKAVIEKRKEAKA